MKLMLKCLILLCICYGGTSMGDLMALCSNCREMPTRAVNQRYCKECHNAHMRAHRPKHSELSPEQRARANARSYAKVYLKRGKLIKPDICDRCPLRAEEMHHEDYSKPLVVIWLCKICHQDETNKTLRGT